MPRDEEDRFFRESWVPVPENGWQASATGLALFASALRARLIATVLVYSLTLVAIAIKSGASGNAVRIMSPIASAGLSIAMIVGVVRFARFPREVGGRGLAYLASGLLAIAALGDLYAAILATGMAGVAVLPPSADAALGGAFSAFWRHPWAVAVAQIATLLALVSLLASVRGVGKTLGSGEIMQRASRAASFLGIVAAMAAELRYAQTRALLSTDGLVAAGIVVLVLALMATAKALGVLRFLSAYLLGISGDRETDVPVPLSAWRNA